MKALKHVTVSSGENSGDERALLRKEFEDEARKLAVRYTKQIEELQTRLANYEGGLEEGLESKEQQAKVSSSSAQDTNKLLREVATLKARLNASKKENRELRKTNVELEVKVDSLETKLAGFRKGTTCWYENVTFSCFLYCHSKLQEYHSSYRDQENHSKIQFARMRTHSQRSNTDTSSSSSSSASSTSSSSDELRQIFDKIDTEKKGSLSMQQTIEIVHKLEMNLKEKDMLDVISDGEESSNSVSFEQFKKMIKLSGKSIAEIQRTYSLDGV